MLWVLDFQLKFEVKKKGHNWVKNTKALVEPFQKQILDASKLKEFADDNFKFDEKKQKVL